MECCSCPQKKREYQTRKRKEGPYEKVNAYTQPACREQIFTIVIFLMQLIGHSVFVVPTLSGISNSILWTMLGLHYALLLVIIYDYIYLTNKDPVDRLILNEDLAGSYPLSELKLCIICDKQVQKQSYHCMKCNRCTEQFDHHCRFLNNCIGSRNYETFFRLLSIYTLYNFNCIGMCIWAAVKNFADSSLSFQGNVWGIISMLGLSIFICIAVASLLAFHCYISCYDTTTYDINHKPKIEDNVAQMHQKVWNGPVSQDRLRRPQAKLEL